MTTNKPGAALATLLLLTVVPLAACQEMVEPLEGPPDFVGTVISYSPPGADSGPDYGSMSVSDITVHGEPLECDPMAMYCPEIKTVHLSDSTAVYVSVDGSVRDETEEIIAEGDRVEVWTTGAEMRSDPPQYEGVQIVILRQ